MEDSNKNGYGEQDPNGMDLETVYPMEELLPVVKELSERYTGKASTSVTYEMAEHLMEAVIYCLKEYRQEIQEKYDIPEKVPVSALNQVALRKKDEKLSAGEAYKKGYQAVINKVMKTRALYEKIADGFNWYGNRALYETVLLGMPAFFLRYDARFDPQNHILTLDYPILQPMEGQCGVDAVYEYLCCIRLEQKFLAGFSQEVIMQLLMQYHADYRELFINLPSIIMNCAIDQMTDHTEYTKTDAVEAIKERRIRALELLIRERYKNDMVLFEYLEKGLIYIKDMKANTHIDSNDSRDVVE